MVSELNEREKKAVEQFCKTLIQYEMVIEDGRKEMMAARVFASSTAARTYYRFHINMKVEFFQTMNYCQVNMESMVVVKHDNSIESRFQTDFIVKELHNPRGPQPAIIKHILGEGSNKVVTLQTGQGKTLISKHCINDLGLRTACLMKGGYLDRWSPDLEESFKLRRGELLVIRGSEALKALMEMAIEKEPIGKVNLISTNTFVNYLKEFEKDGLASGFPITPIEFFDKLGIGFGILDEAHQYPHQIMKLFSYMHIHKFLSLSATMDTKDKFVNKMYEIMYPRPDRFNADFYDAFIEVNAIMYQLSNPKAIRCTGFQGAYSHTTFESSLMLGKNKKVLEKYLDMIAYYIETDFVNLMEKGQKAIVFCGTINMCTLLTKHLQKKFPKISVARYVSKDKMSVMDRADLIVSTVLSAGTAIDIPNLRYNLMTTAIDSQQSNEQTLGRTRRLKGWPDIVPKFRYFVCTSIEKHIKYHLSKIEYFKGKVKSHGQEQAPFTL
jgi:hypothetical protein